MPPSTEIKKICLLPLFKYPPPSDLYSKSVSSIGESFHFAPSGFSGSSINFFGLFSTKDKKIIGILSMRDLYDFANNQLQDSLKQHQEFMFGTGYGS